MLLGQNISHPISGDSRTGINRLVQTSIKLFFPSKIRFLALGLSFICKIWVGSLNSMA
jgi:hypothetical protein